MNTVRYTLSDLMVFVFGLAALGFVAFLSATQFGFPPAQVLVFMLAGILLIGFSRSVRNVLDPSSFYEAGKLRFNKLLAAGIGLGFRLVIGALVIVYMVQGGLWALGV